MTARRTIVIVDDEPVLVRIWSRVLARTGAPVAGFTDPQRALAYIRDNDVALVLCDHRMPGMTGLELLSKLDKDVAFYIVSGDLALQEEQSRDRLRGIIGKPVRPEDLLALAERHLAA